MAAEAKYCHVCRGGWEQWTRLRGGGISFPWKRKSMFQDVSLHQGSGTALPLSSFPGHTLPRLFKIITEWLRTISTFKNYHYYYSCRISSFKINIRPSGHQAVRQRLCSTQYEDEVSLYTRIVGLLVSAYQDGQIDTSQSETCLSACMFICLYYRLNAVKQDLWGV